MSYHCERCGTHLDDLATQCGCDLSPTKAEIDRARIGHATPIMDAVIADRDRLRAENTELEYWKQGNIRCASQLAKANAEVDARDEVITRLLEMLKPAAGDTECPAYALYARACEIAGRTE